MDESTRTGFRGGLNWYRNIDRKWELLAPYAGNHINVPGLYVSGDRDLVMRFRGVELIIASLKHFVPDLRGSLMLPGCGHRMQQERAHEVNDAMIAFLQRL